MSDNKSCQNTILLACIYTIILRTNDTGNLNNKDKKYQ